MNFLMIILSGMVSLFFTSGLEKARDSMILLKSGLVFENPPFEACHAATLVELDSQKIMAAWFGGSYEGCNDVCIWSSLYTNEKWGNPVKIADGIMPDNSRMPCWNPVLFRSQDDKLFLFYKVGKNPREWWGEVIISSDFGNTWSKPQRLPEGFLGPAKNKPIQLKNGEILCPSSTESISGNIWKIHLEITDEQLSHWKKVNMEDSSDIGVIQPCILVHPDGILQMLCRSTGDSIVQTWSKDGGKKWSNLTSIGVPNPNSGIDATALSDGRFILIYNPLIKGKEWYHGRNVLRTAISDDGMNWEDSFTLEDEKEGEYSYPAVIQTRDKQIHILYTANRKYIKHVVLKPNN